MPEIPTTEPLSFRAGDTVKWKRSLSDYPATSWTLKYFLVNSSGQIAITATADGADHLVSLAATDTAGYSAGKYRVQARVESAGGEKYTIETAVDVIEVKPDLSAASTGYDYREHCEIALENIEAVLQNKATADNYSYSLAGRSLSKYSWTELIEARDYYRAELVRLNRKRGRLRPSTRKVHFG